jgi:hypothetical protein
MQMVVVETGGRPVVVGGDVAVRLGELDDHAPRQLRVRAPTRSGLLAHERAVAALHRVGAAVHVRAARLVGGVDARRE